MQQARGSQEAQEQQRLPRKGRRTANACIACRQSKIKCSGTEPCTNCRRRLLKCRFAESGRRVMVSELYLQELQNHVREPESVHKRRESAARAPTVPPSDSPSHSICDSDVGREGSADTETHALRAETEEQRVSEANDFGRSIWISPFALPSTVIKNTLKDRRSWIWLAPWSTWSFTARLSYLLAERLQLGSPYDAPVFVLKEVYPLRWSQNAAEGVPDISGLPSIDHSIYLLQTVSFHLGQNFRFFDEVSFAAAIREFYKNAAERAAEHRLWFIQFLLILAFGKALLSPSHRSESLPGSNFFLRAMNLLPGPGVLWRESLLAIEVLSLVSLYLYSVDQRESATLYHSQALCMAKMEGLHTQLPEDELGIAALARCRSLWWTLYVMDRHFSCSVGIPMTTHDSDITALLNPPGTPEEEDITLISLHVKLSQLLSHIHTSIYTTEKTQLGTFLKTTKHILQMMGGHAQEIERIIHLKFQNSVETMPKGTRHITLLYHQCVIYATRPLLFSVLKERLEKLGTEEEDWKDFSGLIKTLISVGIKSASKTLQILSQEDTLLGTFLPFDLEFAYGAGLHLAMAKTLFPSLADSQEGHKDAHSILDTMIGRGNRIAELRKEELVYLERLFTEMAGRIDHDGFQPTNLVIPESAAPLQVDSHSCNSRVGEGENANSVTANSTTQGNMMVLSMSGECQTPFGYSTLMTNQVEFLDSIGISSDEFFAIADQMAGQDDVSYSLLDPSKMWNLGMQ